MAAYAAFDQAAADRKRKAIQRMRAAAMAAQMLHQANQQQGLPESPTPPKPVMPQQQAPPPGTGHPPPPGRPHRRPVDMSQDVIRHVLGQDIGEPQRPQPPQGRGQVAGRGRVAVGNLAGGMYQQPQAHMPERHIPFGPGTGKPNLGGLVKPPRLPQLPGRPQINPLDEQLATQRVESLGRTQRRPRSRRGAGLLAQILGGFSRR